MNKLYMAQQLRRALELFVQSITDESVMMEVADVYPGYKTDKDYVVGDVFRWGVNTDGESQLYQVLQNHTSAEQWPPDTAPSLYKKIGVSNDGILIWTQPLGATDSYMAGDIRMHNGKKWQNTVDYNIYQPGVYGWVEIA